MRSERAIQPILMAQRAKIRPKRAKLRPLMAKGGDGRTDERTDGWTDGRKDGRTDKASYRVACPQLKTKDLNRFRKKKPPSTRQVFG